MTDPVTSASSEQQQQQSSEVVRPLPSLIPRTLVRSYLIDSILTDTFIQLFEDRVVLGISQVGQGRIGNWLLCEPERSETNHNAIDYNVTVLLGASREDMLLAVYARQVCQQIVASLALLQSSTIVVMEPVLVLGISLHKERGKDKEMFATIVRILVDLYREASSMPG